MASKNRYAEHMKEWETTLASVAANAADLPQLEIARGKLAGMLEEFRELLKLQALHRAEKQQVSKQVQTVVAKGRTLNSVIQATLREHYGKTNEKLVEFGVQPRRARSRKPAPEPQPEPTEPPSPPVK
jgi:hypothetical protein